MQNQVFGYDVFISYSNLDKAVAEAACNSMEARGIRCWMAPRNVLPGEAYAEALINGLNQSRMMVLIFSASSNDSPQVTREVERAVNKDIPIIPFRIENVVPSKSMEYFVSSSHWLDAYTPPFERHLQTLAETVQMLLSGRAHEIQPRPLSSYSGTPLKVRKQGKKGGTIALIVVLLLLLGMGTAAYFFTDGFKKMTINVNIPVQFAQGTPAATPPSTAPSLPQSTAPQAPSPPPSAAGKILFEDDFSKVSPGWKRPATDFMDSMWASGGFQVVAKKPSPRPLIFNPTTPKFGNMAFDIDAKMLSGSKANFYGVIFRVQEASTDYYCFLISGAGEFTVQKQVGGQFTDLVKRTPSTYIKPASNSNRLRVVCKGTQIDVYCNGSRLASVFDNSFADGWVGVTLNSPEPPLSVQYDNLKIIGIE